MKMEISLTAERVFITMSSRLDEEDALVLEQQIKTYLTKGYNTYVFDMSHLQYIDSAGLGTLLSINKQALCQGGHVTLQGLCGTVAELFEITRLKAVFKTEEFSC